MNQLAMSGKSQGLGPHGASSLLTSPHGLRRSHDQPAMRAVPVCQHYWYTPCLLICSFYRSCCALYLSKNQTFRLDSTDDLARATFSLKIRPLLFVRWRNELTLHHGENVRQWQWGFCWYVAGCTAQQGMPCSCQAPLPDPVLVGVWGCQETDPGSSNFHWFWSTVKSVLGV